MVGGLVNQAAQTVNFTSTSFLPEQAQTSLNDFANASIQNINVTGIPLHNNNIINDIIMLALKTISCLSCSMPKVNFPTT